MQTSSISTHREWAPTIVLPDAMTLPALDRPVLDRSNQVKGSASSEARSGPFGFDAHSWRSAWTMPSFYLVPLMSAYLFGAMWIIRGLSFLRRMASRV